MSRRALLVFYILVVWFVISFVTNIIGPLMPIVIEDFHLSLALGGFLPFSFFVAYGIISIPAGAAVERFGARTALLVAFGVNLLGALLIALLPRYATVIASLFVIGLGMAMLQVVINPLMRTVGGEGHFAFFSVMAQLVFGLASFLSPFVFSSLMLHAANAPSALAPQDGAWNWLLHMAPANLPWVAFYWAFTAIFALLIAVTLAISVPKVDLSEDERVGAGATYLQLFADNHVRLFFLAIVAYVGTEQVLSNWMSQFLSVYHHVSPTVEGAHAVALFWGWMSVGCLLGLVLLKLLDSKWVLAGFSSLALVCVAMALFGSKEMALVAFPACGFFLSVMFSIIFSLALNSVQRHHGALSGILCSGILGGAVLPLFVGVLGDAFGLRVAMTIVFITITYILSVSAWARPRVRNETISLTRVFAREP